MKRRGFTLVELIVSLTIFTILLSGMYYAFGTELSFLKRMLGSCENQQISNMVLSRMAQDIRSAEDILADSDETTLLLKDGDSTIEYSLKNQKVRRRKNNYSSYLTDKDDVKALSFSYPEQKLVRITIGEWETQASLRN